MFAARLQLPVDRVADVDRFRDGERHGYGDLGEGRRIAISLVDLHAFNEPTKRALDAGIPVFSYNADAKGNDRLAYIGQDLYASGQALGRRIVDLVGEGPVVGFIATPGQLNIQPRLDGAKDGDQGFGQEDHPRGGRHRPDGQ